MIDSCLTTQQCNHRALLRRTHKGPDSFPRHSFRHVGHAGRIFDNHRPGSNLMESNHAEMNRFQGPEHTRASSCILIGCGIGCAAGLPTDEIMCLTSRRKRAMCRKSRDAKVLTGMRGRLWVDKRTFRRAKVQAEVIKPISFTGSWPRLRPALVSSGNKRRS